MLLVSITAKSAEMTPKNETFTMNSTKYFHEMKPSSQKPCAATLMVQFNEAKKQLRMMKIPV